VTRAKISEYSATANDNTDVNGVNIAEGCPPSSMNNMGREIMAALKRFQVGSDGDGVTVGGALVVSGATSANTFTGTVVNATTIDTTNIEVTNIKAKDGTASATIADSTGKITVAGQMTIDGIEVGQGGGNVATNTAVGASALAANEAGGTNNTAIGYQALDANTTGDFNTAVGSGALDANTTASNNTAVGYQATYTNTTGYQNTAVGTQALYTNATGGQLAAFGWRALYASTADNNSAFGHNSQGNTTTGASNISMGQASLSTNTTGSFNTALGASALQLNTTASNNTAVGYQALYANTTGYSHVAIGHQAGDANTTGIEAVYVGAQAGTAVTTGNHNVFLGFSAGSNVTTGSGDIMIGKSAVASAVGVNDELVMGANTTGKGNQTGFINFNNGIYQGNNNSAWSTTSDQRLKKNIVDNTEGLDKINAIQVRNFEYRTEEEVNELPAHTVIKKEGVQLGVIAQELQQVCPNCVKEQSTGVLSVDTDEIFWHMVNAVKELSAQVTALQAEVNALKGQ